MTSDPEMGAAHAAMEEASRYDPANRYLDAGRKRAVERVHALPTGAFCYALAALAIAGAPLPPAYLGAALIGAAAWAAAARLPAALAAPFADRIRKPAMWCLAAAALAAGAPMVAALAAILAFAGGLLGPAPWLWALSSGPIHPKYAIALRLWPGCLPFAAHMAPAAGWPRPEPARA